MRENGLVYDIIDAAVNFSNNSFIITSGIVETWIILFEKPKVKIIPSSLGDNRIFADFQNVEMPC
jgi:hypothetical protein